MTRLTGSTNAYLRAMDVINGGNGELSNEPSSYENHILHLMEEEKAAIYEWCHEHGIFPYINEDEAEYIGHHTGGYLVIGQKTPIELPKAQTLKYVFGDVRFKWMIKTADGNTLKYAWK